MWKKNQTQNPLQNSNKLHAESQKPFALGELEVFGFFWLKVIFR